MELIFYPWSANPPKIPDPADLKGGDWEILEKMPTFFFLFPGGTFHKNELYGIMKGDLGSYREFFPKF